MERLLGRILGSMVDNDIVGFSDIKIGGAYPTADQQAVIDAQFGKLPVFLGKILRFLLIDFVGGGIGFWAARRQGSDQQQEAEEAVALPIAIGTGSLRRKVVKFLETGRYHSTNM